MSAALEKQWVLGVWEVRHGRGPFQAEGDCWGLAGRGLGARRGREGARQGPAVSVQEGQ